MTWIDRLLRHLHRVFDQTPGAVLAFRIAADGDGLVWAVTEDVFSTEATGGTGANLSLALAEHTIGSLVDAIASSAGYSIVYSNADVLDISAKALIAGTGDVATSNGDHVTSFSNPLWSFLGAWGVHLRDAKAQVEQMLRQMVSTQAEGEWADHWGGYYRVPRNAGEADAIYTARMIAEILQPKANHLALEAILEPSAGAPVTVREPWKERFRLDSSRLDGLHHIQDGEFYNLNVLEIVSTSERSTLAPLAERNKAAGTRLWYRRIVEFDTGPADVLLALFEAGAYPQMLIDMGAIGPRSYYGGGTVYDLLGVAYTGRATYYPGHLYIILAVGTGLETIPAVAGGEWEIADLDSLGYVSGVTVLDVEEQFYAPVDAVGFEHTQAP